MSPKLKGEWKNFAAFYSGGSDLHKSFCSQITTLVVVYDHMMPLLSQNE